MKEYYTLVWNGLHLGIIEEDGEIDVVNADVESQATLCEYLNSEKSTCLEDLVETLHKCKDARKFTPPEDDDLPDFAPMKRRTGNAEH